VRNRLGKKSRFSILTFFSLVSILSLTSFILVLLSSLCSLLFSSALRMVR
jgi:hypothetical protein